MKQLKLILTNGFFILILYLVIILGVLVVVEMEPAVAEVTQPGEEVVVEQYEQPLPLTDAVPQRDITQQRFAPSVMGQ